MDMNTLSQWMDFAKQNNLFPDPNRFSSGSGFQPTQFNTNMAAANWAARMAGQQPQGGQPQDFFKGLGAAPVYASAQAFNPGDRPVSAVSPMNFLSRMVK